MASVINKSLLVVLSIVLVLIVIQLSACKWGSSKRPYGYLRLGLVDEFMKDTETYVAEDRILVRFDGQGFSAMSTQCTYDLSPLVRKMTAQGQVWASEYSTSTYSWDGKVLTGPAKEDLPYYEVRLESGKYGGPINTLYVAVGEERPKGWTLKVR